jgi:hypothetical protein
MDEPAPSPGVTPPPAPTPGTPWYQGKADAEMIGYWENKAWKHDDPVTIALEATKAAREAQKFVGVPPEQLLRLPKDAKDEAGWNTIYNRLGKPKDAKEYDLSSVKFANDKPLDEAFAETLRQTAFSNHLSKDAATAFAQSMAKFMDAQDAAELAETTANVDRQKAELKKSWGANYEENRLAAMQGARRLGMSDEDFNVLGNTVGLVRMMDIFRKIGTGTTEDTFVEGANSGNPKTVASAQARLAELMQDQAWGERLLKGDAATVREWKALEEQITGISEIEE